MSEWSTGPVPNDALQKALDEILIPEVRRIARKNWKLGYEAAMRQIVSFMEAHDVSGIYADDIREMAASEGIHIP